LSSNCGGQTAAGASTTPCMLMITRQKEIDEF
jgi:hypothetical protein